MSDGYEDEDRASQGRRAMPRPCAAGTGERINPPVRNFVPSLIRINLRGQPGPIQRLVQPARLLEYVGSSKIAGIGFLVS